MRIADHRVGEPPARSIKEDRAPQPAQHERASRFQRSSDYQEKRRQPNPRERPQFKVRKREDKQQRRSDYQGSFCKRRNAGAGGRDDWRSAITRHGNCIVHSRSLAEEEARSQSCPFGGGGLISGALDQSYIGTPQALPDVGQVPVSDRLV